MWIPFRKHGCSPKPCARKMNGLMLCLRLAAMAVNLGTCIVSIMAFQRETLVPGCHQPMLRHVETMNSRSWQAFGRKCGSGGEVSIGNNVRPWSAHCVPRNVTEEFASSKIQKRPEHGLFQKSLPLLLTCTLFAIHHTMLFSCEHLCSRKMLAGDCTG